MRTIFTALWLAGLVGAPVPAAPQDTPAVIAGCLFCTKYRNNKRE